MLLNFRTYGNQGPPLVIIHGFLGMGDNWHLLAQQFGKDFSVFVMDMRNHGKSGHSDEFSLPLMVDDIIETLDKEGISKVNIIGHSMGGKVGMLMALENPSLVEKLVVADIAPKAYPPGHDDVFRALHKIDLGTLQTRNEADNLMTQDLPDFSTRQFLLKNLTRDENGNFIWKMNLLVLEKYYSNMSIEIEGSPFYNPTLFIRGSKSKYILDSDLDVIEKLFPNYILETIEGAGHWLHADKPEEFYGVVNSFISEL